MTERRSRSLTNAPEQPRTWDAAVVSAALDATCTPTQDLALGAGHRLTLGSQPTHIDLFPAAGAAQLTAQEAQVAIILAGQEPPRVTRDGVIFEHGSRSLTLSASGDIRLQVTPGVAAEGTSAPQADSEVANRPTPRDADHPPVTDALVTPHDPSRTAAATPVDRSVSPEQQRVRLSGRLGAAPRFRVTRHDVLIGVFPLAVREDDESTTWHAVRVFRERAAKLREADLKKGQLAEVIGYRHVRAQPAKDGSTKLVEEVYAVVVKAR